MRGASPSGSNRVLGRPRAEALIGAAALSGGPCVVDASLIGQGLPLDRQAIKRLCGVDLEPRILAALEPDEDGEVDRGARDAAAGSVLELARATAQSIGLSEALAEVVERAGVLHDIGKADERFQRWLDPENQHSELLAKSATPRHRWEATRAASGWPRGGRHEDLSARLVQAWLAQNPAWADPDQRDLLVHLVISHHGKGRPLVPPADDGSMRNLSTEVNGALVEVPVDLGIIDWSQPSRFRRLNDRFGPWGLALLEAVVRLADHAVSAGLETSRSRLDD